MASKASKAKTRTKKQHTPDYYPVQRVIPLGTTNAAQGHLGGTIVSDAGKQLSKVNRRLYRYGMKYSLKIDLDISQANAQAFDVEVFALRNNWDVQRAYALAKKIYDAAYEDELKMSGSANLARWRDFRLDDGVTGAIEANPVSYDNATLTEVVLDEGEFTFSAVDVAGTEKRFTWGTGTSTALDVMDEWIKAGRTGADPNVTSSQAPYDGVNSDNMSDIEMGNLGNDGNNPPYSQDSDSDMLVRVARLRYEPAPDGVQKLSSGFFDAPCGLFVLKTTAGVNPANGQIVLTVQSGDYKGVKAHAMTQSN